MSRKNIKIYVAGHQGMVGSAIVRQLNSLGFKNIITRSHGDLDLTNQLKVREFFQKIKPDQVYLAAAKVGGIFANNTYPAEFIYNNIMIQTNVIDSAFRSGVKKLLFLGSSCIYPKLAKQPMSENALLSGYLEPTNEPYAIAKIAGIKICESYNRQYGASHKIDYRSIMPTNLYGPGDNYHPDNSHVIPALIRRFHEAKEKNLKSVKVWGTGKPRREFLYVDDMAKACIYIMSLDDKTYQENIDKMCSHINVGSGSDISILELADMIKEVVNYNGILEFDNSKPDGSEKKLMDSTKLNNFGWLPDIDIKQGLILTYEDFVSAK
ncbi:GDP-L-fucose synthase [Gammaproteobacteria bacterium]|nr:GDP-L-fucose synthase [Gammaproteobacteria bacterium]